MTNRRLHALLVLLACTGDKPPPASPNTPDDTDTAAPPASPPAPLALWKREEVESPGSVTFSELLYHAAGDDDLGWIELYNPRAIDTDLSGWRLDGGVSFAFPDGTILAAGAYLVVANDPGRVAGALGPFDGALGNDGDRVDLRDNSDRRIDSVGYGSDDPWPVEADGSGHTLAKRDPEAPSDRAEGWTFSAEPGGTPGQDNHLDPQRPPTVVTLVAQDATWTWSSETPAPDWAQPTYDDSAWSAGEAAFFAGWTAVEVAATAVATADNYYALYLGAEDGLDLRLIGQDADADWTTPESFSAQVRTGDHLYVAAWEDPADWGGPQMAIAEVRLPSETVGTSTSTFVWTLGPTNASPGPVPPDAPPDVGEVAQVIQDANAALAWDAPAVEIDRMGGPWGWAVGGAFAASTRFVWPDTFDDPSITNLESTYALLRSTAPLLDARTTELPAAPTVTTFRTAFDFAADPAAATLSLAYEVDDGVIFYLNGVEVLRDNLPGGPVDPTTLALSEVGPLTTRYADLPVTALIRGRNVLAARVHQATAAPDEDLTFSASLTAQIQPTTASAPVLLNEVTVASSLRIELLGRETSDVGGLILATSSGAEAVLPAGTLAAGDLLAPGITLPAQPGDVLFLYSADRQALYDAVRLGDRPRGRAEDGGPWRYPTTGTLGAPNVIDLQTDVVIHEVMYHHAPLSVDGQPVTEVEEEWIELYNRAAQAVDLSGWQLVDAVAFAFPDGTSIAPGSYLVVARDAAAFAAAHPGVTALGDWEGRLNNRRDRILLRDAAGNPADELRYYDGGRWPEAADGGGPSLELRDAHADNAAAEAWAASDEGRRSTWATYSYQGLATASAVGPDGTWEELVLGLLDAGEVLIDDVSVIEDPNGAARELLRDGNFDTYEAWRLLGNHGHSALVPDPDDPSNQVLRLVATGPTGHMHNHAETTLTRRVAVTDYAISFRARWISGSNQLNSRLYFNRLPRTTLLAQPTTYGTPGAPNTAAVDNLGPTFDDLRQAVAVPAPGQPISVSVAAADPDGVAAMALWYAVDGAPFEAAAMTEAGRWVGTIPGQSAGAIVQLYVEATDGSGATSTFPAAGPASRALLRVDDGQARGDGKHNLRILMTAADRDAMHAPTQLMSDDLVGATVVYDEREVFYDVGARLKGSQRGRPEQPRLGYGLSFHPDQPLRGGHTSALIDRSEGVGFGQREVLMNVVMNAAGSVSGEYNDLVHAMTPFPEHTGSAELQLDRFTGLVLEAQFGEGGRLYEYELIYFPYTTDDGTYQGFKLPQPDAVVGTPITDLGPDKEAWRWNFMPQNNERQDDFDRLQDLGRVFAAPDFLASADQVIDVDQWLRAFAFATVAGAIDNYGGDGAMHNAQFYVRPSDGMVLYFPHDLDFYGWPTMPVVGNGDLARLLQDPGYERAFYGHLADILDRAYNADYLQPWCDQLGDLLPSQDFAGHCRFVAERSDWLMYGAPDAVMTRFPRAEFRITTGGGADFEVAQPAVVLEGVGWVDVLEIAVNAAPAAITWVDGTTWQVRVPLVAGANALELVATGLRGELVGADGVVVTVVP
jgi:hypothetical protein